MKQYLSILKQSQLFSGVGEKEIEAMLSCLNASEHVYPKGSYVFRQGAHMEHIMILAEGELLIQNEDYWGNRSIINRVAPGEMFGEAYLAPESGTILNDVVAFRDSTVLFFDVRKIMTTCSSACQFHTMVIQNLFFAISEKNRKLVQKLGHMSRRTTREKLISYLSDQAKRQNSGNFSIPFNRQQLADFLSVDRSAMSNELSKMQKEGLLEFWKNEFRLL